MNSDETTKTNFFDNSVVIDEFSSFKKEFEKTIIERDKAFLEMLKSTNEGWNRLIESQGKDWSDLCEKQNEKWSNELNLFLKINVFLIVILLVQFGIIISLVK